MPNTNVRHVIAFLGLAAMGWGGVANAALDCAALDQPVYQRVNPSSQANLLTRSKGEADKAATRYGFTDDRGVPFRASAGQAAGLVAVHRLYKLGDFVWISNPAEIAAAVSTYGYVDQGINFYAATAANACVQPVYRFRKANVHRHAVSQGERDALVASGWQQETVSFFAAATSSNGETKFSIAVMPDTQNEAQPAWNGNPPNLNDTRFLNRAQWLADNRETLNLKFVTHTGDVVNWGERDPHEFDVISDGIRPLEAAGIPYSLAVGNHDTRAVCAGGSACPGESASLNVRLSPLFNQYFNGRFAAQSGQFESGKVQNEFSTFEAGGLKWMVLVLELWQRQSAIDWAKSVVASHPEHNVIVVTHAYLDGDGSISGSNGGYGSTSPQTLFNQLVKVYPNVKMVFSGHVGVAGSRLDTGSNGNRIASFLQTFHSADTNPVRIVEIDTAANSINTLIYAPKDNRDYPQYDQTVTGMDFVR